MAITDFPVPGPPSTIIVCFSSLFNAFSIMFLIVANATCCSSIIVYTSFPLRRELTASWRAIEGLILPNSIV